MDEKRVVYLVQQLIVLEAWRTQILIILLDMDADYNMISVSFISELYSYAFYSNVKTLNT